MAQLSRLCDPCVLALNNRVSCKQPTVGRGIIQKEAQNRHPLCACLCHRLVLGLGTVSDSFGRRALSRLGKRFVGKTRRCVRLDWTLFFFFFFFIW